MSSQLPFGVGGGLVAIKTLLSRDPCAHANLAIEMIDAMLAEQPAQQEPFGYFRYDLRLDAWVQNRAGLTGTPFYTSPPSQRTWVGLTDEVIWLEYQRFWPFHPAEEPTLAKDIAKFAHAIEAKLKEKNT